VDLSREGLDELGLQRIRPEDAQMMDSVDHVEEMREIGRVARSRDVRPEHFRGFMN
jgi:uncharacterized protein